jgi:hypothetical protein
MRTLIRCLALALVFAIVATAQAAPKKGKAKPKEAEPAPTGPTASEIDQQCDLLIADKAKHTHHWFAQLAEQGKAPAGWSEYASDAELKARLKTLSNYEFAEVWTAADRALYVETTATSDTAQWSNVGGYCFRSDGSLARAKLTSSFLTTEARARVTRIEHYAPDGRLVRARSDAVRSEHDAKGKVYKTAAELPFASLL